MPDIIGLRTLTVFIVFAMSTFGSSLGQTNRPKRPSPEPKVEASPSPPLATGASIYRPENTPNMVTIRQNAD